MRLLALTIVVVCIILLVSACGFEARTTYEDPEVVRERGHAAATATVMAAQSQAEATRTALQMERDRQDHRQALQMQPMILVLVGAGVVVLVVVAGAVLIYRQQEIRRQELARPMSQSAQLPAPIVNIVNVLPGTGATSRREMWLDTESQVQQALADDRRGTPPVR